VAFRADERIRGREKAAAQEALARDGRDAMETRGRWIAAIGASLHPDAKKRIGKRSEMFLTGSITTRAIPEY
jgi:hypothetical protein